MVTDGKSGPDRHGVALSRPFGHTREDLVRLADHSLLALRPWATPGHARFDLPGPPSGSGPLSDGLEGFARSFLAVGFRLSAADSDPYDHAGWYAQGLAAAVGAASSERWLSLADRPQVRVEAAAISMALHESRAWIWDHLTPLVQEQLVDWLAGSIGQWYPDNNWLWFHNVTQAFLRSVGAPHDPDRIEENLEILDGFYLGDGWYTDGRPGGRSGNVNWYAGWVMHQLSLWYCRMSAGVAGVESLQADLLERLAPYVEAAGHLFGADGAPLFQGRSLIYRYAATGALWTSAVFDASPVPLGQLRRTCMTSIGYFVDRGALDDRGLLSMGWLGEFLPMRQSYSGPGSPYWASVGLTGLVLPPSHPLWNEAEQPMPVEVADHVVAMPAIGWVASATADDGIVRVVNHGVDHSGPEPVAEYDLFCRFGYSTATAPLPLEAGSPSGAADNQVALVDAAGRWSHRSLIDAFEVEGRRAESHHVARFALPDGGMEDGPRIRTVSVVHGPIEVRAVRVAGDSGDLGGAALSISGYAVPRKPVAGTRTDLVSQVVALTADGAEGSSVHDLETPFGAENVVAWCRFERPEPDRWYAVAVSLADHPIVQWPSASAVEDGGLAVRWPDGSVDRIS